MAKKQTGKELTPAQSLAAGIDTMRDNIAEALPPGMPVDRFIRFAKNAIQNNQQLVKKAAESTTGRQSMFQAVMKAAQDGLVVDGKEAALVMYGDAVQYLPMVGGRRKQAAKYGITIDAQVVYEGDEFRYQLGDDPKLVHTPAQLGEDRGEIIGAYAIATLPNGSKIRELMHRDDIDLAMASSRSGNKGPWGKWYSEMARKTVVHRIAKSLPLYGEFDEFRDSLDREARDLYPDLKDGETILDPAPTPTTGKRPKALQQVIDHEAEPEPDEADDGTTPDPDEKEEEL